MADAATAPEWIHLIPAGEIRTNDGRGPYRVNDMTALMAASLKAGDKLVLDSVHATDLAAPRGEDAPARGWIVELQARADGIWGRVEWTATGRRMVEDREYRGVSPVIAHRKDGTVVQLLRASLVNAPNFQGLKALHQEERRMDFRAKLLEVLGLGSDADDDAIVAAISSKLEAKSDDRAEALQSALGSIAVAVGLDGKAETSAIVAGVEQLKAAEGADERITALQAELAGVTTELSALRTDSKKKAAEAFVDGAIAAGRMGIKPVRDRYISMHMKNAAETEELVNAMPILEAGRTLPTTPGSSTSAMDDPVQLAAHAATYQKQQADAGVTIDFATAVMAVKEGRHK